MRKMFFFSYSKALFIISHLNVNSKSMHKYWFSTLFYLHLWFILRFKISFHDHLTNVHIKICFFSLIFCCCTFNKVKRKKMNTKIIFRWIEDGTFGTEQFVCLLWSISKIEMLLLNQAKCINRSVHPVEIGQFGVEQNKKHKLPLAIKSHLRKYATSSAVNIVCVYVYLIGLSCGGHECISFEVNVYQDIETVLLRLHTANSFAAFQHYACGFHFQLWNASSFFSTFELCNT